MSRSKPVPTTCANRDIQPGEADEVKPEVFLSSHEDKAVSVRVTPIVNGFLVKGGRSTVYFKRISEVADAVADALVSYLGDHELEVE